MTKASIGITAFVAITLGPYQLATASPDRAGLVLVETESFDNTGGWTVDAQFMDQMGSPYLLAHGLGKPVAAAETVVSFQEKGDYRVFVRTLDWVARWKVPGKPGRCISATHVALGQVRVMRNTGTMGEAVGLAAAVCKDQSCTPRTLYPKYWSELTKRFAEE